MIVLWPSRIFEFYILSPSFRSRIENGMNKGTGVHAYLYQEEVVENYYLRKERKFYRYLIYSRSISIRVMQI